MAMELDNRDQTIRNDSDMNLDTDSILVKSIELLDVKMLFDPLEEKFHSLSIFVKESDLFCRNCHDGVWTNQSAQGIS